MGVRGPGGPGATSPCTHAPACWVPCLPHAPPAPAHPPTPPRPTDSAPAGAPPPVVFNIERVEAAFFKPWQLRDAVWQLPAAAGAADVTVEEASAGPGVLTVAVRVEFPASAGSAPAAAAAARALQATSGAAADQLAASLSAGAQPAWLSPFGAGAAIASVGRGSLQPSFAPAAPPPPLPQALRPVVYFTALLPGMGLSAFNGEEFKAAVAQLSGGELGGVAGLGCLRRCCWQAGLPLGRAAAVRGTPPPSTSPTSTACPLHRPAGSPVVTLATPFAYSDGLQAGGVSVPTTATFASLPAARAFAQRLADGAAWPAGSFAGAVVEGTPPLVLLDYQQVEPSPAPPPSPPPPPPPPPALPPMVSAWARARESRLPCCTAPGSSKAPGAVQQAPAARGRPPSRVPPCHA